MNDSNGEYLPNQQQPGQKKFNTAPAQEDITFKVIQGRLDVLRDPDLTLGARLLFVFILDLSLSPYSYVVRGVVAISVTKLRENLHACRSSIFNWVKQLMAKRIIWT